MIALEQTVTVARMHQLELDAARFGRSLADLMDSAGAGLARAALDMPGGVSGPVAVFCGAGNNGGDGWVCARQLLARGMTVTVCTPGPLEAAPDTLWGAAALAWQRAGGSTVTGPGMLAPPALIIDALLGTGLSRPPAGHYARCIAAVNTLAAPVLACDIPSGVLADTGQVPGPAVRADATLVLGRYKRACALMPGAEYFGRVLLGDIGLEG